MSLLIRGAELVDPEKKLTGTLDVLIENGVISRIEKKITNGSAKTLDARGLHLMPGLVDIHVHLRQPGREDCETIESGSRAALRGGFTSLCAMPNTDPPCDTETVVEYVKHEAGRVAGVNIYPLGCISRGRKGEELAEIGGLKAAGVVGLTDDGAPVVDSELMRRAMEYASGFGLCVISHAEDTSLCAGGVMNEGEVSMRLGLRGSPNAAESVMIARDIALAELTGCRLHIAHVSTRQGCDLIAEAKKRGISVTGEAAPHHFSLTDAQVSNYDARFKMNPPLRSQRDVARVQEAVVRGELAAIATDHAPHAEHEKAVEFDRAPFGVIGLETALGVAIKIFVESGKMEIADLIHRMSLGPAHVVGLNKGRLAVGADADLTLVDLKSEWEVREQDFLSKSRNSPFIGWKLPGRVVHTLVGGRALYQDGKVK